MLEMHTLADLKLGGPGSAILTGCPGVPASPVFENQRCEAGQLGSEWGRVALSRANCLRFMGSATVLFCPVKGLVFLLGPWLLSSVRGLLRGAEPRKVCVCRKREWRIERQKSHSPERDTPLYTP